jgi:hypothetical protein
VTKTLTENKQLFRLIAPQQPSIKPKLEKNTSIVMEDL